MKNTLDLAAGVISFVATGWAIAEGTPSNTITGYGNWFLSDVGLETYPDVFHRLVLAITCATIVSGAMADRCRLPAYLCLAAAISGFVHPLVSHWYWAQNGWLRKLGAVDYGGGISIHFISGISAAVATWWIGPRVGATPKQGLTKGTPSAPTNSPHPTVPSSNPAGLLSAFCLITIGQWEYHSGYLDTALNSETLARGTLAMFNTTALGLLVGIAISHFKLGYTSPIHVANSGIVAMVASLALGPMMPSRVFRMLVLAASAVGGYWYLEWSLRCRGLDDPVGVVATHAGGGLISALSIVVYSGRLATSPDLPEDFEVLEGKVALLIVQLLGLFVVTALTVVVTWSVLWVMERLAPDGIRVPDEQGMPGMQYLYTNSTAKSARAQREAQALVARVARENAVARLGLSVHVASPPKGSPTATDAMLGQPAITPGTDAWGKVHSIEPGKLVDVLARRTPSVTEPMSRARRRQRLEDYLASDSVMTDSGAGVDPPDEGSLADTEDEIKPARRVSVMSNTTSGSGSTRGSSKSRRSSKRLDAWNHSQAHARAAAAIRMEIDGSGRPAPPALGQQLSGTIVFAPNGYDKKALPRVVQPSATLGERLRRSSVHSTTSSSALSSASNGH